MSDFDAVTLAKLANALEIAFLEMNALVEINTPNQGRKGVSDPQRMTVVRPVNGVLPVPETGHIAVCVGEVDVQAEPSTYLCTANEVRRFLSAAGGCEIMTLTPGVTLS